MPRAADLGIRIGRLPPGPTGSVLDVPGVGLGHATVWRDEPEPPAGRGIARTGVTVLLPTQDVITEPVPAGGAVLNGAGECTGFLSMAEWGIIATPVFLTSTMQVGRVYDAACHFEAVVEASEEAVLNSLLMARTVTGRAGHVEHGLPVGELRRILASHGQGPA